MKVWQDRVIALILVCTYSYNDCHFAHVLLTSQRNNLYKIQLLCAIFFWLYDANIVLLARRIQTLAIDDLSLPLWLAAETIFYSCFNLLFCFWNKPTSHHLIGAKNHLDYGFYHFSRPFVSSPSHCHLNVPSPKKIILRLHDPIIGFTTDM